MKLFLLHGLPGAGKSTWTLNYLETATSPTIRVNRDAIRKEMFGYIANDTDRNKALEGYVTAIQDAVMNTAIRRDIDVISDNTNGPSIKIRNIDVDVDIYHVWFDVTPEECIARDAARNRVVGETVIRGMLSRYPWFDPTHPDFGRKYGDKNILVKRER